TGRPFRADGNADEEAQNRERYPIERDRGEPGGNRVGQNRQNHCALAPEVVGEHAADDAADSPAEQRDGDDRADIGGDLRVMRRLRQGAPRRTERPEQRMQFEPVGQPAEIGGEQDVALVAGEAAIPRLWQGDGVGHGHSPLGLRISRRASLAIETRRSRAALSSAVLFLPTGLMRPKPAGGDCAYYSMEGTRQGRMSSDELPLLSRARGRGGRA